MLLNCGVGEDSWESLGLQGDPINPKGNQSWIFIGRTDVGSWNSNTLATWCEELTHLKRPWCWERLKAGGEGDDRGWDSWMASLTRWTWVWVGSGSWWSTGKSGVLQSMGQPRVMYDWLTDWTEQSRLCHFYIFHPPSAYKNSCPLIVVDGGIRLLTGFHLSTPVASIQQKASFSFHKPCLFIGFWAASRTVLLVTLLSLTALKAASDAGGQRGEILQGQEANCQFVVSTPPRVRALPPSRLENGG